MLQLENKSHWQASLYPAWSVDRKSQITLVIKTGYWFDKRGTITPMGQVPAIEEEDRHYGNPLSTSLAASCETVPFKKGGEILCYGTAHPVEEQLSVIQTKIGLRRGEEDYWTKALRVSGKRSWQRSLLSTSPSEPEVLEEPLPLRYEFAYGGKDLRNDESGYEANPSGIGFSQTSRHHKDLQVPQIEIGPDYLTSLTQRPIPAGYGPLALHWTPRADLSPKIDEEALTMGLCPFAEDLAENFYNAAPEDQRFEKPFTGNETLLLQGLVPGADPHGFVIQLPGEEPKAWVALSEREHYQLKLICDTLVVKGDEQEIHLIWRSAIPLSMNKDGWVVVLPKSEEEGGDSSNEREEHAA
jgi:hypothetical protein